MRPHRTWAFCFLLAACSGSTSDGTGGNSGSGGSGGTGAAGGSGGAGGGSISCESNCSFKGTVTVPQGQVVDGVQLLACFPNAAGDACDDARSKEMDLTGNTTSASFEIGGLQPGTYFVYGAKDNNGDQQLDAGDLVGSISDKTGFLPLQPSLDGLNLQMVVIPNPGTSAPPELVGKWADTYNGQETYQIAADGSFVHAGIVEPIGDCYYFSREEFSSSGSISVTGNQITFAPTSATVEQWDCAGNPHNIPANTDPEVFTWRLGDANHLFLTRRSESEVGYAKE